MSPASGFASEILEKEAYRNIGKSRYTNDKQITDHYAIIPTGQGLQNLSRLSELSGKVYGTIVRRFLSIFYPPAVYQKISLVSRMGKEAFFSSFKVLAEEGYLKVAGLPQTRKKGRRGGGCPLRRGFFFRHCPG